LYRLIEKHKALLVYLPLALYWVVLLILTSLPGKDVPNTNINDKVEHYLAYSILAILLCFTFDFQKKIKFLAKQPYLFSLLLVSFYGCIDELHQLYIPGRSCDVKDWLADTCGGLMGIGIVLLIKRFSSKVVAEQ
jgi:VanZ family protein